MNYFLQMKFIVYGGGNMKRLFAMLMGLFISMSNSVAFRPADDNKSLTESTYYTVAESDAPDYRETYGGVATASSKVSCKTRNFSAQGRVVVYTENKDVTYRGYWLENVTVKNDKDLPTDKAFTYTSDIYIIAPYDCTLVSDSTTNDGSNMTVTCDVGSKKYRLKFTGMKCWYCDVGREDPEDGKYIHTSENQKGKTFKAGNVLGLAKAGETKVVVHEMVDGKVKEDGVTIKDLYTVHN